MQFACHSKSFWQGEAPHYEQKKLGGPVGAGKYPSIPQKPMPTTEETRKETKETGEGEKKRKKSSRVKDSTYYELLNVETSATQGAIRKNYYRQSLKYHPDKNPDNAEAVKKFHAITQAYQILSDENRRKLYDEQGNAASGGTSAVINGARFASGWETYCLAAFRLWEGNTTRQGGIVAPRSCLGFHLGMHEL